VRGDEPDASNGWEAYAPTFMKDARASRVGVARVRDWVGRLAPGSTVLDLACGPGTPRSDPLHERSVVYALDAAPSLARAYQERFPAAHVVCESALTSPLLDHRFDGVLAWGLLFLLTADEQRALIARMARALNPGGRLLFTAPTQVATWADNSTGRESRSLGAAEYRALLAAEGLFVTAEYDDEGENHYYEAVRPAP
jgi:SAM-dependent methyltransferase